VKRLLWIFTALSVLFLLVLFAGCGEQKKDAVSAADKTLELPDKARVVSDLIKIRAEVNRYWANNEVYPENLEVLEIETENPLEDYIYDSNTGNVKNKYFIQL